MCLVREFCSLAWWRLLVGRQDNDPIWGPQRTPTYHMTSVKLQLQAYTSNVHYRFSSIGDTEVYTHIMVSKAHTNVRSNVKHFPHTLL